MKRRAMAGLMAAMLLAGCASSSTVAPDGAKPPDVLIIHAAGTAVSGKVTAKNVHAVSCPTPMAVNCRTLADQTAAALGAKGLGVRAVAASSVADRDDILSARLVVLASPSYFGNVSWKMHKMFDEMFFQIHVLGGDRLGGKPFATLIMGKSEPKCAKSVEAATAAAKACNGTAGPSAIVLAADSSEQSKQKIAAFADAIAAALKAAK
jgi:hypothetical protein